MLSREQILAANDRPSEEVDVPEWGGSVRVASMSGTTRDRFETSIVTAAGETDLTNMRAKLVAACVVGEDGLPLFTQADVEALGHKSAVALERVVQVAQRLNRMGNKALEELRGN